MVDFEIKTAMFFSLRKFECFIASLDPSAAKQTSFPLALAAMRLSAERTCVRKLAWNHIHCFLTLNIVPSAVCNWLDILEPMQKGSWLFSAWLFAFPESLRE